MNFEDIKKIVDKEGKVILLENKKAYIISRYTIEETRPEPKPVEEKKEGLKLEDLPF
ncbi:MAG: hypothetical protein WC157_01245 [Candidatus Paceibacterota bacterium]